MSLKRRVLYVWPWQKLRVSLDFAGVLETRESIGKLYGYLGDSNPIDTFGNRFERVNNMLNATKMGLNGRMSLVMGEDSLQELEDMKALITRAQAAVKDEWNERWKSDRDSLTLKTQTDAVRRADIHIALQAEPYMVKAVFDSLDKRFRLGKGANIKEAHEIRQRIKNRQELFEYLCLIVKVHRSLVEAGIKPGMTIGHKADWMYQERFIKPLTPEEMVRK